MRISDWSSDVCSSDLACRASSSAFCASVKGGRLPGSSWKRTVSASFFFLTSSFLSIGFSGRNDMDDFHIFAVVVILSDGVGHQQEQMSFYQAQGLPTLERKYAG